MTLLHKTVFAVSSGEYSDYGVSHIFESEKDAETFLADAGPKSDYFIEEFTFWPAGTRPEWITVYTARWTPGQDVEVRSGREQVRDGDVKLTRPKITEHEYAIERWREGDERWRQWPSALLTGHCLDEQALRKAMKDRIAGIRVREGME